MTDQSQSYGAPRFNYANALTWARIAAVPVVLALLAVGGVWPLVLAFVFFVAAGITDYLDGYVARRYAQTSDLGRMLDPIADKLLVLACLLMLAATNAVAGWALIPALVILLREVFISGMREHLAGRKVTVHVTQLAKWKTTVQLVAIGAYIIAPVLEPVLGSLAAGIICDILLWAAGAITAWTGLSYIRGAAAHF